MSLTRPTLRQVLNIVGLLLLLAIVIPFVIYAVPGIIGAEGGYVVLSGSMEPAISVGDVVIVDDVEAEAIQENDVITYVRGGEETPTTHRVVEVLEEDGQLAFRTQGDANDEPDATPVPAEQVNGKVILTFPYIGYVVEFANTPYGFAALVVVPFLLLVISELYTFFKGKREEMSETQSADSPEAADGPSDEAVDSSPPVPDDGTAAAAAGDTGEDGETDDDTIAITRTDLRLSLLLLIGIAIYSGWIVTLIQEPWSFAVAFASGIGVLLVGGMYYLAGTQELPAEPETGSVPDDPAMDSEQSDPSTSIDTGAGIAANGASDGAGVATERQATSQGNTAASDSRVISGTLRSETQEYPEVVVDSFRQLETMATTDDDWIVDDDETGGYHLVRNGTIYSRYVERSPDADGTDSDPGSPDSSEEVSEATNGEEPIDFLESESESELEPESELEEPESELEEPAESKGSDSAVNSEEPNVDRENKEGRPNAN
ncbi:signal peptidase I [Halalkaliarchaeum desulfuricum]|uniref:Signal peptidase I n=1 Tax=Halalkaliarchaeum desulfuricum TaxID=2055893 RepID=A0A343TMR7_9EURY|nr:signal peptidase I [Halalkaliarchaeum desulfuricum]AUX10389.1 signal peptidase I [Halalkaliarchaeum desulfuricum]